MLLADHSITSASRLLNGVPASMTLLLFEAAVLVDIVTSWFCDILHWMDVGQLLLYPTRPQLQALYFNTFCGMRCHTMKWFHSRM